MYIHIHYTSTLVLICFDCVYPISGSIYIYVYFHLSIITYAKNNVICLGLCLYVCK